MKILQNEVVQRALTKVYGARVSRFLKCCENWKGLHEELAGSCQEYRLVRPEIDKARQSLEEELEGYFDAWKEAGGETLRQAVTFRTRCRETMKRYGELRQRVNRYCEKLDGQAVARLHQSLTAQLTSLESGLGQLDSNRVADDTKRIDMQLRSAASILRVREQRDQSSVANGVAAERACVPVTEEWEALHSQARQLSKTMAGHYKENQQLYREFKGSDLFYFVLNNIGMNSAIVVGFALALGVLYHLARALWFGIPYISYLSVEDALITGGVFLACCFGFLCVMSPVLYSLRRLVVLDRCLVGFVVCACLTVLLWPAFGAVPGGGTVVTRTGTPTGIAMVELSSGVVVSTERDEPIRKLVAFVRAIPGLGDLAWAGEPVNETKAANLIFVPRKEFLCIVRHAGDTHSNKEAGAERSTECDTGRDKAERADTIVYIKVSSERQETGRSENGDRFSVHFEEGGVCSGKVYEQVSKTLKGIVGCPTSKSPRTIFLRGHHSSSGNGERNKDLVLEREQCVANLINRFALDSGIAARLQVLSSSEDDEFGGFVDQTESYVEPVGSLNRRVDILVTPPCFKTEVATTAVGQVERLVQRP